MHSNNTTPIIIVPMAGIGSRFIEAGFDTIKPLIPIYGKAMIEYAIDSVGIDGQWIFIVQRHHRTKYDLDNILTKLKPGCIILDTAGGVTEGAACTVLLAEKYIDNSRPLILINSDNIIKWDAENEFPKFMESDSEGLILCFKDKDPKWSFAKIGANGYVAEVAEKKPISDNATAGLYIWKKGSDFVSAAKSMILKNIRVNNEFYLCPVYNENIEAEQKVSICMVESMDGVGTPEDLEKFLNK
jgi:dTDP-glucose pyrophosphorylase